MLTMAPDSTTTERECWYRSLRKRNDYIIEGIEVDGVPVGAVGIKRIDYEMGVGEYFGYIGEECYMGHGVGKKMMAHAIRKAQEKGLKKLVLKVLCTNKRAINLYVKTGFIEVDRHKDIVEMKFEIVG